MHIENYVAYSFREKIYDSCQPKVEWIIGSWVFLLEIIEISTVT